MPGALAGLPLPPLALGATPAWRAATLVVLALAVAGIVVALRVARTRRLAAAGAGTPPLAGLWGHVAALRDCLLWCLGAWMACTMLVFSIRLEPRSWGWLPVPALQDNLAAQAYRGLARLLVPDGVQLVVLKPLDGFNAEFTIAMALGLALALPIILWQLGSFLGPALRPRERRVLRAVILPAVALFAAGATFAVTLLCPALLDTLYGYPTALGAQPFLLVGELVSFAVTLALVFGVAALTPMVMAGLGAAGLVGWRGLLKGWRHATIVILVVCALVTDGTLVTLAMVSLPLLGLYFVGVGAAAWTGRKAEA